jgi:hypothetical protein
MAAEPAHPAGARRRRLAALALASLISLGLASGQAQTTAAPTLDLHGTRLASACAPGPWQQLAAELRRQAPDPAAAELQALVHALLCQQGPVAARQLLAAAPRRLPLRSEGTGQPPARLQVATAEALQPLAGQAWAATLHRNGGNLVLQWQADEACVRSADLAQRGGRWVFTRLGQACD